MTKIPIEHSRFFRLFKGDFAVQKIKRIIIASTKFQQRKDMIKFTIATDGGFAKPRSLCTQA